MAEEKISVFLTLNLFMKRLFMVCTLCTLNRNIKVCYLCASPHELSVTEGSLQNQAFFKHLKP